MELLHLLWPPLVDKAWSAVDALTSSPETYG
jgi:hypothetical protein